MGGPTMMWILTGRGTRPELRRALTALGLRDGKYEGPTGFPTVLQDVTIQRGLASAALWAASPVYLRELANPKLSAALLSIVKRNFAWRLKVQTAG